MHRCSVDVTAQSHLEPPAVVLDVSDLCSELTETECKLEKTAENKIKKQVKGDSESTYCLMGEKYLKQSH